MQVDKARDDSEDRVNVQSKRRNSQQDFSQASMIVKCCKVQNKISLKWQYESIMEFTWLKLQITSLEEAD